MIAPFSMKFIQFPASWPCAKRFRRSLVLGATVSAATLFSPLTGSGATTPADLATIPERTQEGFLVPRPAPEFSFPRDHGSHPEYAIEWWYLVGHLTAGESLDGPGRRFGFQATFFRQAGPPRSPEAASGVSWDSQYFGRDQLHLAHMALLDTESGEFRHAERLDREGWNARASVQTLDLRQGDWSLKLLSGTNADARMRLVGGPDPEARFELDLVARKPLALFGEGGWERKGAAPTASSYYLSFTRLEAQGRVHWQGRDYTVSGLAWMDHEISSNQLADEQTGWNWACVQLDDGRELMLYVLRLDDGGIDPYSTVAWIARDGSVRQYGADAIEWTPLRYWTSPRTGGEYPVEVRITVPEEDGEGRFTFVLKPFADAVEIPGEAGGIAYWEGACQVMDFTGERVLGSAYMELTGFSEDLSDRL